MKWRRLLLALLLALAFDAVVPFEPTAAGKLQIDDDLEEAAQLRARRDHRRDAVTVARRSPVALRVAAAPHVQRSLPRVMPSHRLELTTPPPRVAADPTAPPPPGEDH